jgi:hypothetical protein
LLDLGQSRLFAVARQVLIEPFENLLLTLRLGKPALQLSQLALHGRQLLLRLLRQRPALLSHGIALRQTLGQFLLSFRQARARFHPLPSGQPQGQNGDDRPRADTARSFFPGRFGQRGGRSGVGLP